MNDHLFVKIKNSILASMLFVLILAIIYFLHNRFFSVNVVFYAAIGDAVIAALICAVLLWFKSNWFSSFEKIQLIAIWLLAGYAFAISVPAVIDRSLSFYILEKLAQRGGAIKLSGFEYVFVNEYMKEHRLIDVRLTEQSESGTIVIDKNCVRLTSKGKFLAHLSRLYRMNLLPKHRLLMGEYTDDLTDPFRHSEATPDYLCN